MREREPHYPLKVSKSAQNFDSKSLGFTRLSRCLELRLTPCDEEIERISALKCRFFRSPQGIRTPLLADVLRERDLLCIGWSARGFDSVRSDPKRIVKSLVKGLDHGSILLMHDGGGLGGLQERPALHQALPLLIREVRARGFEFVRLDHLLNSGAYR